MKPHRVIIAAVLVSGFVTLPSVSQEPNAKLISRKVFEADDNWRPIDYQPARIAKDSVLDFSSQLDAPAGQHGPVVPRDGQLFFQDAPGKPLRLYGVVVSHTLPFQDKEGCERVADFLAATGYNWVRLHNYNFGAGVMRETGSAEFAPAALDQLEYFLACLKQRGIYFTFPINAWGYFKAGDVKDVPEFRDRAFRFESNALLPISADLQRWFREYARHLLEHINPYTHVALKDDSALLSLELTNENSLFAVLGQMPEFVPIYKRKCEDQLRTKLGRAATEAELEKELPGFVLELQESFYLGMKSFLRELGIQRPLTDLNFRDNMVYTIPRALLDYVDVHHYWSLYHNQSGKPVAGNVPYQQNWANPNVTSWGSYVGPAAARIFGKPYASSEFNGCYPAPYWIHTGPFEGAFAAMQGWTMVARCGLAAHPKDFFNVIPPNRINTGASPLMMLSERIGATLLAQGEMRPLARKLPIALTPQYLIAHADINGGPRFPKSYTDLALKYQLGTILIDGAENTEDSPCLVVPPDMDLPASLKGHRCLRADDSLAKEVLTVFPPGGGKSDPEFNLDAARGCAWMCTPRSETFLLPADVGDAAGRCVQLSGNHAIAVCFACSRDERPIADSRRLLILHLTDLKATGLTIEPDPDRKANFITRELGRPPLLVQQNTIQITLKTKNRDLPQIWALKFDGSRAVKIAPQWTDRGLSFAAQAVTAPDVFGAYEVVWPQSD